MSRVQRQHSYDDEIKPGTGSTPAAETGLGLPAPMPRRASAYDVYAPGILAAANQAARPTEERPLQARRPSFRVPAAEEPDKDTSPSPETTPTLTVEDDRRNRRRGSQL
ncbi:fife [Carabus blaptoides fortunei]